MGSQRVGLDLLTEQQQYSKVGLGIPGFYLRRFKFDLWLVESVQMWRMDCTLPEPGSTLWRTDLECENSKRTQLTILCFFPVAKGRG